jgi:hypothetical protein
VVNGFALVGGQQRELRAGVVEVRHDDPLMMRPGKQGGEHAAGFASRDG